MPQEVRDHSGVEEGGRFLTEQEAKAIQPKNNYHHIFPKPMTFKDTLLAKDNLQPSTANIRRSEGGVFNTASKATATAKDVFLSRPKKSESESQRIEHIS